MSDMTDAIDRGSRGITKAKPSRAPAHRFVEVGHRSGDIFGTIRRTDPKTSRGVTFTTPVVVRVTLLALGATMVTFGSRNMPRPRTWFQACRNSSDGWSSETKPR
jgi:hypothetical protein